MEDEAKYSEEEIQIYNLLDKLPSADLDVIYHYTSVDGFKGIVENSNIWFSNVYYLNDSGETFYFYKILNKVIFELKSDISKDMYNILKENCTYMKNLDFLDPSKVSIEDSQFYVASFSEDNDSLPMWNYYTKNACSAGYSIGFNVKDERDFLKFAEDKDFMFVSDRVIYDFEEQYRIVKSIILDINKIYKNEKKIQKMLLNVLYILSFFFKHPCFAHEKEYRIICHPRKIEKITIKYRTSNSIIIPYIEFDIDLQKIISVKISPTVKDKLVISGIHHILKSKNVKLDASMITMSKLPLRY